MTRKLDDFGHCVLYRYSYGRRNIIIIIIIIIIITLFKSQIILAEHECSTNWGDCKSNKSNQMLVFEERGKPEYPEKNLSEQSREPTNSAHI